MSIQDPVLQASKQIVAASMNSPPLRKGASGQGVQLLQAALIDLGYRMPASTRKTGKPDGIYGKETKDVVSAFQKKNGLKQDGNAGRQTIAILDQRIGAKNKPAKMVGRSRTPKLKPSEYKVGKKDPPVRLDAKRPHGDWPETVRGYLIWRVLYDETYLGGGSVRLFLGEVASRSMHHYLRNTGRNLKIRFRQLVAENREARKEYRKEIQQARRFVETLSLGDHPITSVRTTVATAYDSHNWALAIGGYQAWGKGNARVMEDAIGRYYELDFEYKFKDRYNFDPGKGWPLFDVPLGSWGVKFQMVDVPLTGGGVQLSQDSLDVRDKLLYALHRQGYAKEFITHGSFTKALRWRHGHPVPWEQYDPRRA